MSSLSSVPSPAHQPEAPKPSIVPPRERKKRGPARWLIPLVLILILGGLAWWKFRPSAKTGGPVIAVPVVSVTAGDIQKVVRVTGTVAARNFASLLAPRVLGSRSNVNRGGMGGALAGGASDFNLVLLHLIKAGAHVKKDEVVAQFDPTNQLLRLDDYKDAVIQTNNSIRKLIANLAANKEAHDQTVRAAKAGWDQAALDLRKAPVQAAIDAENAKLTAEQNEATYKQLVFEDSLVVESQAATIRVSELTKDQMAIELQRAEGNVKRMEMHSPMDGIAVMASIIRSGEWGQVREGDQVNAGQGSLGKLVKDEKLYNETTASMTNLKEILQKINNGQGSVGKLVNDQEFYKDAKLSLQKLDKATESLEDTGPLSLLGSLVTTLL